LSIIPGVGLVPRVGTQASNRATLAELEAALVRAS
jgi:hypothetical protein